MRNSIAPAGASAAPASMRSSSRALQEASLHEKRNLHDEPHGGVAQRFRALGLYPSGPWFKSKPLYHLLFTLPVSGCEKKLSAACVLGIRS